MLLDIQPIYVALFHGFGAATAILSVYRFLDCCGSLDLRVVLGFSFGIALLCMSIACSSLILVIIVAVICFPLFIKLAWEFVISQKAHIKSVMI